MLKERNRTKEKKEADRFELGMKFKNLSKNSESNEGIEIFVRFDAVFIFILCCIARSLVDIDFISVFYVNYVDYRILSIFIEII